MEDTRNQLLNKVETLEKILLDNKAKSVVEHMLILDDAKGIAQEIRDLRIKIKGKERMKDTPWIKPQDKLPNKDCECTISVVHFYHNAGDDKKKIGKIRSQALVDYKVKDKSFTHKTCIASFSKVNDFEMRGITECGFERMKLPKPKLTYYYIVTPPKQEE